jgi:16S rRNA processing protein RimM
LTEDVDDLVGPVFLRHRDSGPERLFSLEHTRVHHGTLLASLEGVTTRTEAEALRSHAVLLDRDRLPASGEGAFLTDDLPGLTVLALEEDGPERLLGRISSVSAPAGQQLWSIAAPDGSEILFPAVPEFVVSVDFSEGVARIVPPPGLLDLYLSACAKGKAP